MKVTKVLIAKLASAFANSLRSEIGAKKFAEVKKRNNKYYEEGRVGDISEGCCASHDFCDANMTMFYAFGEVVKVECDPGNDEHIALINAAWGRAKKLYLS